jgi:S1-C subfamily serine protease
MSIKVNPLCIGFISTDSAGRNLIGTACVINGKNSVVTCSHVISNQITLFYIPSNLKRSFRLRVVKDIPNKDVALLATDSITNWPMPLGQMSDLNPKEMVFYVGFKTDNISLTVDQAIIQTVGITAFGNSVLSFIDFYGVAKPGYSGGPVFNSKGEIVGIIRSGYFRKDPKTAPLLKVNIAVDISDLFK